MYYYYWSQIKSISEDRIQNAAMRIYLKPPSWLILTQSISVLLNCAIFFILAVGCPEKPFQIPCWNIETYDSALHRELDRVKRVLESPRKLLKDSHALLSEMRKKGEEAKSEPYLGRKGSCRNIIRTIQKCLVEKGMHGHRKGLNI